VGGFRRPAEVALDLHLLEAATYRCGPLSADWIAETKAP
jgi:hypothetical protein